MKSKQHQIVELEAELLALHSLVRTRRKTLARLRACPNKDCPCRAVWRAQTEQKLANQVGKVSSRVSSGAAGAKRKAKAKAARKG